MFNVDFNTQSLGDAMSPGGSRVELPFETLLLWIKSGSASEKWRTDPKTNPSKQGTALYFGGWGCGADEMGKYLATASQGLDPLRGMELIETESRQSGKPYQAYFARYITCAVLAKRVLWTTTVDPQSGKKSTRSRVNLLVHLADYDKTRKEPYQPWGWGVLSGKSYAGSYLERAVEDWERSTAALRAEVTASDKAPRGLPVQFFWLHLGTFGSTPVVEYVGKGERKSPITPMTAFLPDSLDKEYITRCFVGADLGALFVDAIGNAKEWLDDWNQHAGTTVEVAASDKNRTSETAPPEFQDADDDIPF